MENAKHSSQFTLACILALFTLLIVGARQASTQQSDDDARPALPQGVLVDVATLLRTTHTSQFDPPSPDPAGVVYLPASRSLLISDSEVNEMAHLFTGDNLFQVTLDGNLLQTMSTLPHSGEPTGIALNVANGHFFVSDDSGIAGYYEMDPGPDGILNTTDDVVTFVSSEAFGAMDPEGIAFDDVGGRLFIADGADGAGTEAIYIVDPGANNIFDGAPPEGDDVVTSFDVLALGIRDPDGLAFNEDNGHLYILSGRDRLVAETLPDGTLLRLIDVAAVGGVNLAGLAYGPASDNPGSRSLYLVDRGEDNSIDPEENDGVLYEVSFPLNIDNLPPFVEAGHDQIIRIDDEALLEGVMADDGNPDPPGTVTASWTQTAGPGTANFADASALQTIVSFSTPGSYVLRLTVDDGALSAWDEVTITVLRPGIIYLPAIAHLTVDGE